MKSKFTSGTCSRLQILALVFLLVPLTVSAQMDGNQKTSWAGKYEGSIKAPNGDLLKVTLELKDENGKILIPGFYERVKKPSSDELAAWNSLPFNEEEYRQKEVGARELTGEPGYNVMERTFRP